MKNLRLAALAIAISLAAIHDVREQLDLGRGAHLVDWGDLLHLLPFLFGQLYEELCEVLFRCHQVRQILHQLEYLLRIANLAFHFRLFLSLIIWVDKLIIIFIIKILFNLLTGFFLFVFVARHLRAGLSQLREVSCSLSVIESLNTLRNNRSRRNIRNRKFFIFIFFRVFLFDFFFYGSDVLKQSWRVLKVVSCTSRPRRIGRWALLPPFSWCMHKSHISLKFLRRQVIPLLFIAQAPHHIFPLMCRYLLQIDHHIVQIFFCENIDIHRRLMLLLIELRLLDQRLQKLGL